MKKISFLLLVFFLSFAFKPEVKAQADQSQPKIVVGLMVDQMRWDYLYRFRDRYGEGGFKRLISDGFSCENTFIRHYPTVTAAGHSSVYTGSTPAVNGIVGNSWYDRSWGKTISNVEDTLSHLVGIDSDKGRSPRNMLTTTIGDELRIATNYQSKVVGVAIKDRAAILPAGHTANGAFWYEGNQFITSSYYMEDLPQWAKDFNKKDWKKELFPDGWNTLYSKDTYVLSQEDDKDYEGSFKGEDAPVFPHMEAPITGTPFGNALTLSFAKAAIEGYDLGSGSFTDLIAVSLSSPDMIGHQFGPNSIEVEDNYLRLDKDLEEFFNYLDNRYGKDGYLFFITADHGANHSPGYLEEHNLPTGIVGNIGKRVGKALEEKYGVEELIKSTANSQIYLDYDLLKSNGLDKMEVAQFVAEELKSYEDVDNAFAAESLAMTTLPEPIKSMYIRGYNPKRSGDVLMLNPAGWKGGSRMGATHGSWFPYDAHIPLVWMGHGIKPGHTNKNYGMTDIAPTIAALLRIQMPSGSIGEVITEITHQ